MNDGPTDATAATPESAYNILHTSGLVNPDGILGVVPGRSPLTIIYEQKILSGDNRGSTAFPASAQCNTFWAGYYANNPFGTAVNDDITHLRLAQTIDGIHFTDLGILQGLNDPMDVTATGTRWLATAGTILQLEGGKYGLLFSGGGCIVGWFAGRVYAPSGTLFDHHNLTVMFAGYHTQKPKNGLGDYRAIGHVSLHSSQTILAGSGDVASSLEQDEDVDEQ